MTDIPESYRDLLDAQFLTLATIAPDGRPQLSEVWFLAEGDTVRISLNTSRRKVANLHANPKCTVFILDIANPLRYLEIRGDALLEPDDDYAFAAKVGAKYGVGDMRAWDGDNPHRVVLTVQPTRVVAHTTPS